MKHAEYAAQYYKDARELYNSYKVAIGIPALTAFMAGVLFGGFAAFFIWAMDWIEMIRWSGVVGFTAAIVTYGLMYRWWREMVTGIEAAYMAAALPSPVDPVRVEIVENAGKVGQRTTIPPKLPGSRSQMQAIARFALSGGHITMRYLKMIFEEDAIVNDFYNKMVVNEYARWRDDNFPKAGIELTTLGWAVFRSASGLSNPPTPPGFIPIDSLKEGYNARTHTNTDSGDVQNG